MKELTMLTIKRCPDCIQAKKFRAMLIMEHPEYADVPFKEIDENKEPDVAKEYDYYYVPSFFIGKEKLFEFDTEKEFVIGDVERCLKAALEAE